MAFTIDTSMGSEIYFEFDRDNVPYHSGACDVTIRDFIRANAAECAKLNRETCIDIIKPYGSHDTDELAEMNNDELLEFVVWIAAGNVYDNTEEEEDSPVVGTYLSTY
jgi:hypothetical protein